MNPTSHPSEPVAANTDPRHADIPPSAKLVHTTLIPIRWGDMDAYGHVNNTIYFRYMEQARVEWLEALSGEVRPGGEGPVIVNASCTFLAPLVYPGTVEVRTYIEAPGRSSLQTHVEMRRQGEPRTYALGAAKIVWINTVTEKSVPLPELLRSSYSAPGSPSDAV